jgi:hypothetical protein
MALRMCGYMRCTRLPRRTQRFSSKQRALGTSVVARCTRSSFVAMVDFGQRRCVFAGLNICFGAALGPEALPLDSAGAVGLGPRPLVKGSAPVHHGTTSLRCCTLRIDVIPCRFRWLMLFLFLRRATDFIKITGAWHIRSCALHAQQACKFG